VELFDQAVIQVLFGLGSHDDHSVVDRLSEPAQERRLSHSGSALDDHELRATLHRRVKRAMQHGQLIIAPNQRVRLAALVGD